MGQIKIYKEGISIAVETSNELALHPNGEVTAIGIPSSETFNIREGEAWHNNIAYADILDKAGTQAGGTFADTITYLAAIVNFKTASGGSGATNLQEAYDGGSQIILGGNGSVKIKDAVAPSGGDLIEIKNNADATVFGVDASGNTDISGDLIVGGANLKRISLNTASTGLYTGGILSINVDTTKFDLGATVGHVIDSTTDPLTPTGTPVNYAGGTAIAVTNILTHEFTHIYLTSAGGVLQSTIEPTPQLRRDNIYIGKLIHTDNVNIIVVSNQPEVIINPTNMLVDFWRGLGLIILNGNRISANGVNLSFDRSAGDVYQSGVNYSVDKKNPNIRNLSTDTLVSFRYRTQTSIEGSDITVLSPSNYDNAGTITAIAGSNNQATNVRVYLFQTGNIRVQYGQQIYSTLQNAITGLNSEPFIVEPNIGDNGILLGVISVTKGATDLSNTTEAKFSPASKFGEISTGTGATSVSTFQDVYTNSVQPQIGLNSLGGIQIRDNATPLGTDLFSIQDDAGTTPYFSVNNLGVGIKKDNPTKSLDIVGGVLITGTASEADINHFEIDCNAAGFGGVKAFDIDYITGAINTGSEEDAIVLNIDDSASLGGNVFGMNILATEGGATVYAINAGATVCPLNQFTATFQDMDSALVNAVDRRTEFITAGSNIEFFTNDNDTVTIGHAAKYFELEFLLSTGASQNCSITFEYSTGVGTWGEFFPTDGTNGMRVTGVMSWQDDDIPTWAIGTGSEYLIRLTRTRNSLTTPPIENKVQIAIGTNYYWDKDGDISVNNITAGGAIFANNLKTGDTAVAAGATTGEFWVTLSHATLPDGVVMKA